MTVVLIRVPPTEIIQARFLPGSIDRSSDKLVLLGIEVKRDLRPSGLSDSVRHTVN